MVKKDLDEALKVAVQEPELENIAPDIATKAAPAYVAPSRQGKKHIGGYYSESVFNQLNLLAAELTIKRKTKVTMQGLLAEALNDLFVKYDNPPVA